MIQGAALGQAQTKTGWNPRVLLSCGEARGLPRTPAGPGPWPLLSHSHRGAEGYLPRIVHRLARIYGAPHWHTNSMYHNVVLHCIWSTSWFKLAPDLCLASSFIRVSRYGHKPCSGSREQGKGSPFPPASPLRVSASSASHAQPLPNSGLPICSKLG